MAEYNWEKALAREGLSGTGINYEHDAMNWDVPYNLTDIAGESINKRNLGAEQLGGTSLKDAPMEFLGDVKRTTDQGVPASSLGATSSSIQTGVDNRAAAYDDKLQDFAGGDAGIAGVGQGTQALTDQFGGELSQRANLGAVAAPLPPQIQTMLNSPNPAIRKVAQKVAANIQANPANQAQTRVTAGNQEVGTGQLTNLAAQASQDPNQQIRDVGVQGQDAARQDVSGLMERGNVAAGASEQAAAANFASANIGQDSLYTSAKGALERSLQDVGGQGDALSGLRDTAVQGAQGLDAGGVSPQEQELAYSLATRGMDEETARHQKNLQTYMNSMNLGGSASERGGMGNIMEEDMRQREGIRSQIALDALRRSGEEGRANLATQSQMYNSMAGLDRSTALQAAGASADLLGTKSQAELGAGQGFAGMAEAQGQRFNQQAGITSDLEQGIQGRELQADMANQGADQFDRGLEYQRGQDLVSNMSDIRKISDSREIAAAQQNLATGAAEEQASLARKQLLGTLTTQSDQLAQQAAVENERATLGRRQLGADSAASATAAASRIMEVENDAQQQEFNQILQSASFENQAYQQGLENQKQVLGAADALDTRYLREGLAIDQSIRNQMASTQAQAMNRNQMKESTGFLADLNSVSSSMKNFGQAAGAMLHGD
jgi:hypothetical protein